MAKITSNTIKGMQGTLQGLTFVKSKSYGDHVRSKRGTVKPATLNDALLLSKDRLLQANELAGLIFNAIRDEYKDGSLWSRMLSLFRKQLKEGKPPGVECLMGLECSNKHPLERVLHHSLYTIDVKKLKRKLDITIQLHDQPEWKRVKYIDGYQLSIFVVFPDFLGGTIYKEKAIGNSSNTNPNGRQISFHFSASIPKVGGEYMMFMKLMGCEKEKVVNLPHVTAMRVIGVGVVK